MKISEIFHSIQGEGTMIGRPSVFLRLAVCNLHCSWCDSKYTWDWAAYDYTKEVKEMSVEQVAQKILRFPCRHLVITGGEPLLQQDDLSVLVNYLLQRGFDFEVETNGTIVPAKSLVTAVDQWNVSPKISNSANVAQIREKPEAYSFFAKLDNAYFKFVVTSNSDVTEINDLVSKYKLLPSRVILMPEGTGEAELNEKSYWISEICKTYGFRFTTRLHIILYGNKRGT